MSAERADRPFVDEPGGPDDDTDAVAEHAARHWGMVAPVALRRGMNALYRSGDSVIRVGAPTASAEAGLRFVRALHEAGVPVLLPLAVEPVVAGRLVATAWPWVEADRDTVDWEQIGRIVWTVHAVDPAALPAAYPLPHPGSFPWWDFDSMIDDVDSMIDPAALEGLRAAIDRHGDWAERASGSEVLCHGDVHPGNVVVCSSGSVLIDWDLACWAPPGWDHAMLHSYAQRWGGPPEALDAFERGYGCSLRDDPVTRSVAELRNVAATLMRVRAGRHDPEAAAEAERRLRFWRGDSDPPAWRAQ